jgi:hypothetical protein
MKSTTIVIRDQRENWKFTRPCRFLASLFGTKKMDDETAQHWLEKERDRLRQQLTIIEGMISGFEK